MAKYVVLGMRALEAYRFWEWITGNRERYQHLDQMECDEMTALFEELNKHLGKYCSGLTAEIDTADPCEKTVVITAKGYTQYFELAEDLVLMAPKVKGWQFIALRPAVEVYPIRLDYEGLQLSSDNLWYLPYEEPGEPHLLAVIVLFKDYEPAKEGLYFRAANAMLFLLLGEKSGILDVPYLQVDELEEKDYELGILELETLPEYIEMRKGLAVQN